MSYLDTIHNLATDPEQLELTYQQAVQTGDGDAFAEAIDAGYTKAGDNLLLAAWHYRLAYAAAAAKKRVIAWSWAIPLGLLNGLLLWLLSDDQRFTIQMTNPLTGQAHDILPAVALLAAPISAAVMVLFLALAGKGRLDRALAVILGLAVAVAYVLLLFSNIWPRAFQEQYLTLMVMHLALLAWAAVGVVALAKKRDARNRFAFLVKSLEAFVVFGLFAIAGGLFTSITFGLFSALDIEPPDVVIRLFLAGGAGLIAIIALALVYDPTLAPARQSFDEGLSKLVAMLMRLLLPLSVLVLLVYLAFIPFNFREPFENREVLIIFNAMLFAVMALMVGATPVRENELGDQAQTWLRRGIIALAALSLIVSLYALAAILYRTSIDRPTPNRLTFIGWNVINIGVLVVLLVRQWRAGRSRWLPAMHSTFATGMVPYVIWTLVVILVLPWLFRGDPAQVAHLPTRVQQIVFDEADPILLKCGSSPHIYLLEDGEKRWVKDIATFKAEGFRWSDVEFIRCDDLRDVPDGPTIPPGAGPPPQP
ncbi:MAG: hypothetical protein U9R25_15865 [Chloroflexota bacterium]|nr:hypothetical protein [Chloroflexota bacterium]